MHVSRDGVESVEAARAEDEGFGIPFVQTHEIQKNVRKRAILLLYYTSGTYTRQCNSLADGGIIQSVLPSPEERHVL